MAYAMDKAEGLPLVAWGMRGEGQFTSQLSPNSTIWDFVFIMDPSTFPGAAALLGKGWEENQPTLQPDLGCNGTDTSLGGGVGEGSPSTLLPQTGFVLLNGDSGPSEAMPRLGAKVHGQVVLQGHVDGTEVIVDPHVGQRGHVRGWDRPHVEWEVVEHRPHGRQGEGWVREGIGWHLWLWQVLRNGPREGLHPLHLLHRLLQRGSNAFEGVL